MAIVTLNSRAFRNLKDGQASFKKGLNVFLGDNGQGKTNLLEAIYFLATTRSFRRASPVDMIAHGKDGFELAGTVTGRDWTNRLSVSYGQAGLMRFKDEKKASPEDYLPALKTVAVSTSQMSIIDGGPEERRRFMDRGIMSLSPRYLSALSRYNHVRRQRNAVLQDGRARRLSPGEKETLQAWDDEFVKSGVRVMTARKAFNDRLKKKPGKWPKTYTGRREGLTRCMFPLLPQRMRSRRRPSVESS